MSKKAVKIIGIVFIAMFGGLVIYLGYLGMFNSVDIKIVDSSEPKLVYGKKFEGSLKSKDFQNMFVEVGKMHEDSTITGKICGWYLNNPEKNNGNIKAIIGVIVPDSLYSIEGYEYYTIPSKKVLQAYVNANYMIAAAKTYSAITNYAKDNNITLKEEYFEWYSSKENVYVEVEVMD